MNETHDDNKRSNDEDILDQLLQLVFGEANSPAKLQDKENTDSRARASATHKTKTPGPNISKTAPISGAVHLSKISFENYKSLGKCVLELGAMNILTGPNNAGKSTALSALQVLAAGIRVARRLKPRNMSTPDGILPGYLVATENLAVSLENVHTDYADSQTTVRFEYQNGNALTLWFPPDGACILYISEYRGNYPKTPTAFRKAFAAGLVCVPVLGPLEHNEPLLQENTVKNALESHRAARHFRNYWYQYPENFESFSNNIKKTWPGVEIEPPELVFEMPSAKLHMFCREHRITRELYWMGFGFQVWCQLLTHVSRAGPNDILVVDEPETYLHPIVQRRLLSILRETGAQVVLATHSAPIVMDAGPYEVYQLAPKMRQVKPQESPSRALAFQLGISVPE